MLSLLPASQVTASSSRARATSAFFLCFLATLLAVGTVRGAPEGLVPGPDLVVGHVDDLANYGVNGTQLGLGIQTTACNAGNTEVRFLAMPDTDHSVVAAGLGVMHAFEAGMALLLPRGLYTALLSGADGGTGVGLIEIHNLNEPTVAK